MARGNFKVEAGLDIRDTNGTGVVTLLSGTGAPIGTSGPTDDAAIGSLYFRQDGEGQVYRKSLSTSSASDYEIMADSSVYTALGIADDAENMGTFTGDIITDNVAAKVGMQDLETELVDTRQNVDDLITLSGEAENATDHSTFTGTTIADNRTTHEALQDLETAVEAADGGTIDETAVSAATPTVVNTCLVDTCNMVEWEVYVYETATEATRESFKITAMHNGTTVADATLVDDSVHTKLKLPGVSIAGLTFVAKLTGATTSQTIGLEISATAAVTVVSRMTKLPF